MSAQNYINLFTDPKARAGTDGFLTVNYGDYADPAALLSTLVVPGGSRNYDNFDDKQILNWLETARSTADPNARAALVAKAEQRGPTSCPGFPTSSRPTC